MPQLIGKFVWFEHASNQPADAQRFYGEVLGWKVEKLPMGKDTYEMIKTGDKSIGGYTKAEGGAAPHWISYLSVANVDATLKALTAAGGKITVPAFDVPTVGRMAGVTDPAGASFFLFTSAEGNDTPDDPNAKPGGFMWNELHVPDGRAAVAFYEKVFGYGHDDMDMGPEGVYRILKQGETGRAGIAEGKGAAHWLPYVHVDDCDAALARVKRAGGTVDVPATDIPNVGRFGILRDPQGAQLAVMKPSPAMRKP